MLTASGLLDADPQVWVELEDTLAHLARDMDEAAAGLYDRGVGPLRDSWADEVGEMARAEFVELAASFEIVGVQLRSVCSVISGMAVTMIACRREVSQWITAAGWKDCTTTDNGSITPGDEAPLALAEWAACATTALKSALRRASEADDEAARVLRDWRLVALDVNQQQGIDKKDLDDHVALSLPLGVSGAVASLEASLPRDASPQGQRAWWDFLTEEERDQLMRAMPLELASMPGLPAQVTESIAGGGGVDRVTMLKFVAEHWDDTSLDWAKPDGTPDDNCTNFVSLSLEAGGLDHKGWWTQDADNWTRAPLAGAAIPGVKGALRYPGGFTDTWGGADPQHDFFATHGSQSVGTSGARPGDAIYWTHAVGTPDHPTGEEPHAAVVSRVLPNGDVLYSQHSDGALDLSLSGRLPRSNMGGDQEIQVLRVEQTW